MVFKKVWEIQSKFYVQSSGNKKMISLDFFIIKKNQEIEVIKNNTGKFKHKDKNFVKAFEHKVHRVFGLISGLVHRAAIAYIRLQWF